MLKNLFLFAFLVPFIIQAQTFVDVGQSQNFGDYSENSSWGCGVSFYDINNDGWDDVTFASGEGRPYVFLNNNGVYQQFSFLDTLDTNESKGATWVDFDNDGDNDFFLTTAFGAPILMQNTGDLNFTNISSTAGFFTDTIHYSYGHAWGDYDNDGFLDVYICSYSHSTNSEFQFANSLYHNNGDGTFTDVAEELNVAGDFVHSFMPVWVDYDRDGDSDLYIINDRNMNSNIMYRNNGDATFTDVTLSLNLDISLNAMTNSFADYDNDFDLDLYVTNGPPGNVFYQNNDSIFIDVTTSAGVAVNEICWDANWLDADNDGDQDLHVATIGAMFNSSELTDNSFFLNEGDGTFLDLTSNSVFPNNNRNVFSSAIGDFNNDGKVDMVSSNASTGFSSLWENTTDNGNNYVKISLEGVISNRDGVGSWIEVYTETIDQATFTMCGEGFISQDSQHEIIGLNQNESIDSLIIRWPSGIIDFFENISVNQSLLIVEGSSIVETEIFHNELVLCYGDTSVISMVDNLQNIEWSTEDTTQFLSVFESGSYSFTAINQFGIIILSDTVEVVVGTDVNLNLANGFTCNDECTGSVSANMLDGGFPPYEFSDALNNLCADYYEIIVGDSLGCFYELSFTIEEFPLTKSSVVIEGQSCYGACDAEVVFDVSGSSPPYEIFIDAEPNSLCAGEYTYLVSDGNGCISEAQFEIDEVEELSLEVIVNDSLGLIEIIVDEGTPPYEIEWSTGETNVNSIFVIDGGVYWVSVTDENGCILTEDYSTTVSVTNINNSKINIYPNPSSTYFNVDLVGQFDYVLFSADGRVILNEYQVKFPIDISVAEIRPGTYFLEVKNAKEILMFNVVIAK